MARVRNRWGWGFEDAMVSAEEAHAAAPGVGEGLGFDLPGDVENPVPLEAVRLPAPRLEIPAGLRAWCTTDTAERAAHAYGKSYLDAVRALRGRYDHAPDVVARPRDDTDVEALLAWAADVGAAVIPYGGGTSVVGGVEARIPDRFAGAVTVDLSALDALHEVDDVSRAARIGAGASGPVLERRLAEHGLTLRFYPQSFELSTLGGWIATRAGGHFATLYTRIDDLVESVRMVTPAGVLETRRVPASGAGPNGNGLALGSEGVFGVITEAWVRLHPR
ncbi:MAG TPA: FAD-binding oxidoreductase, partial [Solirubrobacteraceae bacterium]|nr:FAD-binding oxidoreductase [Solirubrobacteraceae bacterium]